MWKDLYVLAAKRSGKFGAMATSSCYSRTSRVDSCDCKGVQIYTAHPSIQQFLAKNSDPINYLKPCHPTAPSTNAVGSGWTQLATAVAPTTLILPRVLHPEAAATGELLLPQQALNRMIGLPRSSEDGDEQKCRRKLHMVAKRCEMQHLEKKIVVDCILNQDLPDDAG